MPPWHGARWSAWLRSAAKKSGLPLENWLLALKPLRSGAEPLRQGEKTALMLTLEDGWEKVLPTLLQTLDALPGEGEFSSANLAPASVLSWPDKTPLWQAGQKKSFKGATFSETALVPKLAKLLTLQKWTLVFDSPLRLPLPPGHADRGRNQAQFAGPQFIANREGLARLLEKVRFFPEPSSSLCQNLSPEMDHKLALTDMRYNAKKKIALGGVAGSIGWSGTPDYETARRLLAGEYCGAGKNARFGLGFWHIAEL